MKKFLIALLVALTAASMAVSEAEAKRLGGGGSFGRQSSGISRQAPAQSPNQSFNQNQARPATPPAATPQSIPPKPASPWRNILGGALLGLGLGALLSHFGIGGGLASMISSLLMIGLLVMAVMFILRLVRSRNGGNHGHDPQPAYAGGNQSFRTPDIGSRIEPQAQPVAFQAEPSASAGPASLNLPPDFDAASFLRHAKTYYIRLQAAWDRADINDIREFTTPEMFAELRLQLQERGASPNFTDVVSLEAEMVGFERTGDEYMASVRFSGMIKESENAPAEPFAEVWNMTKPVSGQGGWVLAGIQQLS